MAQIRARLARIEGQLRQHEQANEPMELSAQFVGPAFDEHGNLVFDSRGNLAYMVMCEHVFGPEPVDEYPNERLKLYFATEGGKAEFAKIHARADALHKEYMNRPPDEPWQIRPHGEPIGPLTEIRRPNSAA